MCIIHFSKTLGHMLLDVYLTYDLNFNNCLIRKKAHGDQRVILSVSRSLYLIVANHFPLD